MAIDVPLWKPCGLWLCRRLASRSHCQFGEMARDGAVAIVTAVYKIQIKLMSPCPARSLQLEKHVLFFVTREYDGLNVRQRSA